MATFMRDLESSGLLADDEAAAASGANAGAAPMPAGAHPAAVTANGALGTPSTIGNGADLNVRPGRAAADAEQAVSGREGTAHTSASLAGPAAEQHGAAPAGTNEGGDGGMGARAGTGDDSVGEQAEQRVLGALQGADGWFEVMDMASRQVWPLSAANVPTADNNILPHVQQHPSHA